VGAGASGFLAFELALRLTLLDLVLRPVGNWLLRPLILSLAVVALLRSNWLRQPAVWMVLAILTGARVILDWPLADNHAYLFSYWCLAIALALAASDTSRVLALNGRLLIGLVFLFASIWKITLSGQYLDGTFFQVTMLTDPRLEGFARVAGGLGEQAYLQLSEAVNQHLDAPPGTAIPMPEMPERFRTVAMMATIWNAMINPAIAIAFLWPARNPDQPLRHLLLLVYCATTYAIATVDGFGWLLLAMGAAQTRGNQLSVRRAYILVFALILAYREIPWAELLFLPVLGG
jgi:hypothetical protein